VIFETTADRSREQAAADRLAHEWRAAYPTGRAVPSEQFEHHDLSLIDGGNYLRAIVEIKCRNYNYRYFADRHYMISAVKVARLQMAAGLRLCRPLIMVSCDDDDFLLDLNREEYWIETRRVNDRGTTHDGIVMRDEEMCFFSAASFLHITQIRSII